MSEVKFNNQNNQAVTQSRTVQAPFVPASYACTPVIPSITNNNGFLPAYIPQYYTSNYGYQTPYNSMQYPAAGQAQNPVTHGATIQAGGTTCEVPQGTNGLNIIINSPTVATPGSNPMINTNTNCTGCNGSGNGLSNASATAAASTGEKIKKRNVVALTDDYIKNLENYLRSPNKDLKIYAVQQLIQRFEEDESRKTNKPLNALLNLALQAKEYQVRFAALTLLKTGLAGGNDVTVQILNNLQQSNAYNGLEANDVKEALLKMSEVVVKVPDNSAVKHRNSEVKGLWE